MVNDIINTRRIPGLVWLRAGVSFTGKMDNSLRPVWLYGCVHRWAAGIKGRGVYVIWMVRSEGRCSTRWRDDRGRLVPCREKAVASVPFTDPGCPDDPNDGPHEATLWYCRRHAERARVPQ